MPVSPTGMARFEIMPHRMISQSLHQIVLQFIQTLQAKPIPNLPDTPIDPLANFIGATTDGNLAQAIDGILYDSYQ